MARDETARERDPDRLLDRRSYIRLAAAAAAVTAVAGASESADAATPDAVPAPAGEARSTEVDSDGTAEDGPSDRRDPSGEPPEAPNGSGRPGRPVAARRSRR